jgi:hypothetical protein
MTAVARGWMVIGSLWLWACMAAAGQAPTTNVADTVYRADGTPAGGTVTISWGSFTTTGGSVVPAGSTTVALGTGGALSVAPVPNANSTPMGNYYTAVFHLNDGTTSRQYWVVPYAAAGSSPVRLAAIANSVLPTTVAMQTVSKAYVDNAIAAALTGTPADSSPYVLKAGDTMTGALGLPGDPVSANQAADKNYVDENVAAVAAGLGQKVSLLPSTTQVVSQPAGTQLEVNDLNGELYATQYASGGGNNGIQNALSSSNCVNGCTVDVEPTYPALEQVNVAGMPSQAEVIDHRDGAVSQTAVNPLQLAAPESAAVSVTQEVTLTTPALLALRPEAIGVDGRDMVLTSEAAAGGSNQFPEEIETPPYFKSTYGVLKMTGNYNTQGQHVQAVSEINCYAVGDCLAGSQFLFSSGGYRDSADEGAHPFDLQVAEDNRVFTGSCLNGCTTGSTQVTIQPATASGTQGDGRYLIDTNTAKVINAGKIVSGGKTFLGTASFSGTSFGVSTFLETAQAANSQTNNLAPGTVTLAIATSGVPSGFATNTAPAPASGVACVADVAQGSLELPNFEMANYSVVDGTHVQITLAKVHNTGAVLAIGGLCGYGLEQTADTISGLRQLFPVVGSTSATSLYYADGLTPVIGDSTAGQPASTSGYLSYAGTLTSLARSGNVVTATTAANLPVDLNGLTLTIAGVADSSYNGSYAVTTTGPNTFTYADAGANSTSTGGTASYLNGSFALYPMAEVVSVLDPATKTIDGAMTLGPNTAAWAAGDAVEEPHYYQQLVDADTEYVTQYVPKPIQYSSAGKTYQGTVGPGTRGWEITNGVPATNYLGGGGTHLPPDDAFNVTGVWNNDMEATAGVNSVLKVHCNLHGCNRWDSTYALFDLDSQGGQDFLYFAPQSDAFVWNLLGTIYSMTPTSFNAPTINVTTLNATTLNGSLSAGSITSGTVAAARLPVFAASGASHSAGAVPDPGATAGTTRYLREDGSWTVPSGGGGGMTWPASAGIAVYAGSSAWGMSLTAPASALVGVSDTQALTNKSIAASEVNSGTLAVAQVPAGSYRTATGTTDAPTSSDIQAVCGVVVYTSATGATVTLPTSGVTAGGCVRLKNLTASTHTVVVAPSSGMIEGNASVTLNYYADAIFAWNGSAWTVYGGIGVRGSSNLTAANSFVYENAAGSISQFSGTNCIPFANGTASVPGCASSANLAAVLGAFSSTANGYVPSSGGGTSNFLRADGSWATPTATVVSPLILTAGATSQVPLTLNGISGQTAHLFDLFLTAGGTQSVYVSSAGALYAPQGFTVSSLAIDSTGGITSSRYANFGAVTSTGLGSAFSNKTANYTTTTSDNTLTVDASGAARTITLQSATGGTYYLTIVKSDSTSNTVTVQTSSSQTISGRLNGTFQNAVTSLSLTAQGQTVTLKSNNSNWWITESN